MDIDLLFAKNGEVGLIANENLVKKVHGAVFTMETGLISLEFVDMDYMDLNIPVEQEFYPTLDYTQSVHLGSFKSGHIAQAYQVPLMIHDDPYRGQMGQPPQESDEPLTKFEYFIRTCIAGQPVHRDDLGNEEAMGCVLGDAVPSSLQFAPHLARRRGFEAQPKMAPGHVPGIGLGTSGGGGTVYRGSDDDNGDKKK